MRAKEFIFETTHEDGSHGGRAGKLHKDQENILGKIHRVAGTADRTYDINRAMMAVASSDGKNFTHKPNGESWVARHNLVYPYTEIEHNMLHHAYKAINLPVQDAISYKGREPDDTHKSSPVRPFKGYKKK